MQNLSTFSHDLAFLFELFYKNDLIDLIHPLQVVIFYNKHTMATYTNQWFCYELMIFKEKITIKCHQIQECNTDNLFS
jgi:hypothetical protein